MTPALRRESVAWARTAYQLSECRACRAVGDHRSNVRHRSRRPPQTALRTRLKELATTHVSYGYLRLYVRLRREGWLVNKKLVYRLYREEGLVLKRRRPKRRKSAVQRMPRPQPVAANERWAMDFVHDTLAGGQTMRILTIVDVHTRECVALVPQVGFRGADVARVLSAAGGDRGLPAMISVDNGAEFTSKALDHWAYWNRVQLDFSRPGKPTDNAHVEAFNASLRRECLSQHWFTDVADAERTLRAWRSEYNTVRPHSSLANHPPAYSGRGGYFTPSRERVHNSLS